MTTIIKHKMNKAIRKSPIRILKLKKHIEMLKKQSNSHTSILISL